MSVNNAYDNRYNNAFSFKLSSKVYCRVLLILSKRNFSQNGKEVTIERNVA